MADRMDYPTTLTIMNGEIAADVLDYDGNPNHVLEINRDWSVKTCWWLQGNEVRYMDGTWTLRVEVESIGEGFEGQLFEVQVPYTSGTITQAAGEPPKIDFCMTVGVMADLIPDVGVYKLVTVVTFKNVFGETLPIAGFGEAPLFQFYAP